jgi:hypothetical protein
MFGTFVGGGDVHATIGRGMAASSVRSFCSCSEIFCRRSATPKPFVAACDKFIYLDNLTYSDVPATPTDATTPAPKIATPATQLKGDTALASLLRNAVEAASDDDGWASLATVGHIITKQRPDFDSRTYGDAKLSDLITATTLFEPPRVR